MALPGAGFSGAAQDLEAGQAAHAAIRSVCATWIGWVMYQDSPGLRS